MAFLVSLLSETENRVFGLFWPLPVDTRMIWIYFDCISCKPSARKDTDDTMFGIRLPLLLIVCTNPFDKRQILFRRSHIFVSFTRQSDSKEGSKGVPISAVHQQTVT